ncbi:hypothetical protein AAY473_034955 [Plecturocebus cupreus]
MPVIPATREAEAGENHLNTGGGGCEPSRADEATYTPPPSLCPGHSFTLNGNLFSASANHNLLRKKPLSFLGSCRPHVLTFLKNMIKNKEAKKSLDLPTSASQSAGITGMSHHAQPRAALKITTPHQPTQNSPPSCMTLSFNLNGLESSGVIMAHCSWISCAESVLPPQPPKQLGLQA